MGPLRLDFAYNQRNRPVSLTRTGDGTQVSRYLYNALEQLVQRSTTAPGGPAGAVQYIYGLDGSLLAEADAATGKTLREYIWLPQDDASPAADNDNEEGAEPPPVPLALVTGVNTTTPKLLMVHADHLSRPVRLTDATRATVWQASYDPFGQPVSITGTVEQNLRFPGQYFLIESGLSYNWHRLYDPATGRYTQPDPLRFVDGPSVYGYVGASPMMRVDPEGLAPTGKNKQRCEYLARKIENYIKDINKREKELAEDKLGLPETDPNGKPRDSREGHRQIIAQLKQLLADAQAEYDIKCKSDNPDCPESSPDPSNATRIMGRIALGGAAVAACFIFAEVCIPALVGGGTVGGVLATQ